MKPRLLLAVLTVFSTFLSFAQSPDAFKYQAVIRDASNLILNNQAVGMQLIIHQGTAGGTAVYTETFAPTTNAYGLVNLEIGTGTTVDDFSAIDWANGPYFMETAVDVTGGTSYSSMGTSQLLSVPYALHATTATFVDDADADPSNELQTLSLSNDTLYLTDGGQTYLGDYASDSDSTNELQVISISNDTIFLSDGGFVDLGTLLTGAADNDWEVNGNNMRAMNTGNLSIGTTANNYLQKVTIGDTGLFRVLVGHAGNFNEMESGRLVFTEDVDFNGTCGFEWHHDGDANTLSLESGCTTLSDTSVVFTRNGEVRIPERVKIGENSNPACDVHIKQSSAGTTPSGAGIRFEEPSTTTQYQLWNGGGTFNFGYNGTRVSYINNVGTYTQASDMRLKTNIQPIGSVLDRVNMLRPVEYNYNHMPNANLSKGFIAQEVQEIFPEMVSVTEGTDFLALPYDEFSVIAVKAIQEQQAIIDEQQKQIDELKANVEKLMQVIQIDEQQQETSTSTTLETSNPGDADQ